MQPGGCRRSSPQFSRLLPSPGLGAGKLIPNPMPRKKLLLVGWDSADWKLMHPLMDAGKLPVVNHLVNTGVSGNLTTLEPQLSPMLWTSIATGKMAYHHGVNGFTEVDPVGGAVVPVSAATRECRTIWEMLGERGLRSHVVSWFATQGERDLNGKLVSNLFCHLPAEVRPGQDPATWPPPPPGTYWPPELAAAMNHLRVSPQEVDPDEIIRLFVPDAPRVDQTKDNRLWFLASRLAESYSVHAAATHLMTSDPDWDFMAVYYRALDEICHRFMPYHPPQMEGIPDEDFARHREVVNSAYRLHDLQLARLLQLAGPETTVLLVSDHGFHSDHLRPRFTPRVPAGITVWHRPQGVFIASGPGFKQDDLIFGARLLDVTPTILHFFGLPVGADLEGRVLTEAFAERVPVATIPTWERPEAPKPARCRPAPAESRALLDQFVALGYIDELAADPGQAAAETRRENDWNLARACMYGGRDEAALPLLEACLHARPERMDFAQALAGCQLRLGLLAEAEITAARACETFGRNENAHLLRAAIAMQKEDFPEALRWLELVRATRPGEIRLQILLAQSYVRLRRWAEAESAANLVLAADPHHPDAFLTLARLQLHQGRSEAATASALEAIGLQYGNPLGHYLLGSALAQVKQWAAAEQALLNALRLNPALLRAQRQLARVYRALGRPADAEICEHQARITRVKQQARQLTQLTDRRAAQAVRAAARAETGAHQQAAAARRAAEAAAVEPLDFVIVSGLPRSGTSLMMQMLQAGGLPLMTDGRRPADQDNPEGYWEWEPVKRLAKNPRIIEQARGRVIKIISALLPHLPPRHRYQIIYMTRPVEQVVASQWTMLARNGRRPKSEKEHLIRVQREHSAQILAALRRSDRVQVLEIAYPALVADPIPLIAQLAAFLPGRFQPGPAVSACVQPKLHRHRQGP